MLENHIQRTLLLQSTVHYIVATLQLVIKVQKPNIVRQRVVSLHSLVYVHVASSSYVTTARTMPKPKVYRMWDNYFWPKPNVYQNCSFPHM